MLNLNPTYGALFVGVLLSAVLFGVTMLQTFVYFQQYPADKAWRKLAVCWLWFLDALHLALSAHFVYHYLVNNYGNPDALSQIVWSFKLRIVVDAFVVCSVHTLYTSRLWTLLAIDNHVAPFGKEARRWSRQKMTVRASATRWIMCRIAPWVVSGCVVIGYGIAIVMCYETFSLTTFGDFGHAPWATYVPLGSSTFIDALIAGALCYFLTRCRMQSAAMNGPIKTLIVYTLNTGIITSFCTLIAVITMVAFPTTFIPIAIEFLVIKLYINSYLAMLNARIVLHPVQDHQDPTSFLPHSHAFRNPLDRKALPFPAFPTSTSSIQLTQRSPTPNPAELSRRGTHATIAPSSPSRASAEWAHVSTNPKLPIPRLSHPEASPPFGVVETAVGLAFPALVLGQRLHSFASSSSSATTGTPATPTAPHPFSAVYATPVDPLSPALVEPRPSHPLAITLQTELGPSERDRDAKAPEYAPCTPPPRFAPHSSMSSLPSPSSAGRRGSRARFASAYSTDAVEDVALPPLLYSDSPGNRYTRMVHAVRESRRGSANPPHAQAAEREERDGAHRVGSGGLRGEGVEDEGGVWVWGGPGKSLE
ncbi:hypothetical protein BD413DRAFT_613841 [Trametes elegans]|nr:hypothetical protein BD413DRAFT_613841 [Trametes elegans]